jgi:hypothetical protein
MSLTNKFDPKEGVDYGRCNDCDAKLPTNEESSNHMSETFKDGKSHSVRVLNPDRHERIQREVDDEVSDAVQRAMEELDGLVERGDASAEEIFQALGWHSDFADAWQAYVEEMAA